MRWEVGKTWRKSGAAEERLKESFRGSTTKSRIEKRLGGNAVLLFACFAFMGLASVASFIWKPTAEVDYKGIIAILGTYDTGAKRQKKLIAYFHRHILSGKELILLPLTVSITIVTTAAIGSSQSGISTPAQLLLRQIHGIAH